MPVLSIDLGGEMVPDVSEDVDGPGVTAVAAVAVSNIVNGLLKDWIAVAVAVVGLTVSVCSPDELKASSGSTGGGNESSGNAAVVVAVSAWFTGSTGLSASRFLFRRVGAIRSWEFFRLAALNQGAPRLIT